MTDNDDFITVDKDSITQCTWCGSIESKDWMRGGTKGRPTGYYCSKNCWLAGQVELNRRSSHVLFCMGIFALLISWFDIAIFLMGIFCFLTSLYASYTYYRSSLRGLEIRKQLPKESRIDERTLGLVVLERAKISASCHKCGGNLNLSEIGPERIYRCRYCGAEGIIEWPLDDEEVLEGE